MDLFNYLLENSIDTFSYRGKTYNVIDLISEDDCWLNMPMDMILAGGEIVELDV